MSSKASFPVQVVSTAPNRPPGQSILAARIEAAGVWLRPWLPLLHIIMFVLFLALLLIPVVIPQNRLASEMASVSNTLIWGIWFPLVFLSVLFSGRSWCGILCPMGAASAWMNRIGPQWAIPGWLRWEGTPVISFILITILGQTVGVRDYADSLLEVFGGTLLAALMIGFFYGRNKRAWCRHACPIGLLLGVFSRIGAVQFAAKRKKAGGDGYTEKGVCPTMIDISRKEESRHCIECFNCVNPSAKGGLFVRLRHPGEEVEKIRDHNPNTAEVAFLFFATGLVLGGFLWLILPSFQEWRQSIGTWAIEHGFFWVGNAGPWWLMSVHPDQREVFNWLDFFMIVGWMISWMIAIVVLLSITTGMAASLSGRLGGDGTFKQRFIELGYQYAPVAMVSMIIGLAAQLFTMVGELSLHIAQALKLGLFTISFIWSLHLGRRILERQGVTGLQSLLPLAPGAVGSLVVGAAWWPAIFG